MQLYKYLWLVILEKIIEIIVEPSSTKNLPLHSLKFPAQIKKVAAGYIIHPR
ncbi:MAG: hypothetical protein V1866_03215 [archaeon]